MLLLALTLVAPQDPETLRFRHYWAGRPVGTETVTREGMATTAVLVWEWMTPALTIRTRTETVPDGALRYTDERSDGTNVAATASAGQILLENSVWHHYAGLAAAYDAGAGGAQRFTAFVPSAQASYGLTVEEGPLGDATLRHYRVTFDIGVVVEMWLDDARVPILFELPAQDWVVAEERGESLRRRLHPEWADRLSRPEHAVEAEHHVQVPMRDGVRLSADVYRPATPGRYPVILNRTPYGNNDRAGMAQFWAARGYVFVTQDCRGRFDSEGEWDPFRHERADGKDTVEWCADQPWSDGRVGMVGGSYEGWVQWWAAIERPRGLVAIAPEVAPADAFVDGPYVGGALELPWLQWSVFVGARTQQVDDMADTSRLAYRPLATLDRAFGWTLPWWTDWMAHWRLDAYWKEVSYQDRLGAVEVPALSITGWWDSVRRGAMTTFPILAAAGGRQRLIIGPWLHSLDTTAGQCGEVVSGIEGRVNLDLVKLRWFDHWLKGIDTGMMEEPLVELYLANAGEWIRTTAWPPSESHVQRWYLRADRGLSREAPGDEPPDRFTYDPSDPVSNLGQFVDPSYVGPNDTSWSAERSDVLAYTSAPLDADLDVVGRVRAVLRAASTARDTDFTAKLADVGPDGRAIWITDGIIRARFRDSFEEPSLLDPGEIYDVQIDLAGVAWRFARGHCIRVEVSSSLFPQFAPNLNTGGDLAAETDPMLAEQTVYHDGERASFVELPVYRPR